MTFLAQSALATPVKLIENHSQHAHCAFLRKQDSIRITPLKARTFKKFNKIGIKETKQTRATPTLAVFAGASCKVRNRFYTYTRMPLVSKIGSKPALKLRKQIKTVLA